MPSRLDYNILLSISWEIGEAFEKNMTKDGRNLIRPEKTICSADLQYLRKIT
jgi:hypothetical protein